tara:strand:+ start:1006 stop:1398 length:393 start_codon:yes stop_codon:yes gene_type:complete
MKQYCPTCGAGTEYSLTKPKFCNSCGEAFASNTKLPVKRVFRTNPVNPIEMVQEEEPEEEFEAPNINKLQFDLESSSNVSVNKIQDIVATNSDQPGENYQREVDTSYSKETFTQDFLKDAGSNRRPNAET